MTASSTSGFSAIATIDDGGMFAMDVPPGDYTLTVPGGWYGGDGFAFVGAAATPFNVGADGAAVDVTVPTQKYVRGRVSGGGKGIAGVFVDAYYNGRWVAESTSGSDGRYAIAVPPGGYVVAFHGAPGWGDGYWSQAGFTTDISKATLVSIGAADAVGIDTALPSTQPLTGRIVSSAGGPVPHAYIQAWVNGSYFIGREASSTGTFTLPAAPGAVTLWVYDRDGVLAPGWRTSTGLTSDWNRAAVIQMGSTPISGVTIKMPPAAKITAAVLRLNGATEGPLAAAVFASAHGQVAGVANTDDLGHAIVAVLPGTYTVQVQPESTTYPGGWYRSGGDPTPDSSLASPVVISAGMKGIAVYFKPGDYLLGTMTDTHGVALPSIEVGVFVNGSHYTTSSTNGAGAFEIRVPPGTYRIALEEAYGTYQSGWLGAGGWVQSYEEASDVVVPLGASNLSAAMPLDMPPAAPTGAVATPYHESARVEWIAPPTIATRPITHYQVRSNPGGRTCIATIITQCVVSGLQNGIAYSFTVTASTFVGSSPGSAPSDPVAPLGVPGAPTTVAVTRTGADITVSWLEATPNAGPVLGYRVTVQPGSRTCVPEPATAATCTVAGLADGRYGVAVAAANALGEGPASDLVETWVDTVMPAITAPVVSLRSGVSMSGTAIPVNVKWSASDGQSGLVGTELQASAGGRTPTPITLPTATATSLDRTLGSSTSAYRFDARATDAAGNTTPWREGAASIVTLRQETGTGITYRGTWTSVSSGSALGGKYRSTKTKGASVTYSFTGRGVTLVMRKGTNGGRAAVYVDGKAYATVDLRSTSTAYRFAVLTRMFAASGRHTIKVVCLGTSGRPTIWVDAFATIR